MFSYSDSAIRTSFFMLQADADPLLCVRDKPAHKKPTSERRENDSAFCLDIRSDPNFQGRGIAGKTGGMTDPWAEKLVISMIFHCDG